MSVNEERVKILRMVEEGKISSDEAAKLLEALEVEDGDGAARSRRNRFVRVRILSGGNTKVNINLPLELARVALKFVPSSALESAGGQSLDLDQLVRLLEEGVEGKLVDIEDEDTKVEVYVE